MTTIGRTIAAARENAGYSLADLSARTCIRRPVLAGIEDDDFRACGGDFYARGHIRAVCRELGIDPAELLECYDREYAQNRAVPAFTDKPITGRAEEADGDADGHGGSDSRAGAHSEAAESVQEVPSARTEDSESAAPAGRAEDAHAAAGASQH
ncbi:helix-turn-helix domain-containing protein, partial [Streptomonospora algeriensis]